MRSSINYPAKDVVLGVLEIAIGREAEKQGEVELLRQMLGYDVVLIHNEDGKPFRVLLLFFCQGIYKSELILNTIRIEYKRLLKDFYGRTKNIH